MSRLLRFVPEFTGMMSLLTLSMGILLIPSPARAQNTLANCNTCTTSCGNNSSGTTCTDGSGSGCGCTCKPISANDPTGPCGCKV